jgi:histidinol-phosphate aminotransferase
MSIEPTTPEVQRALESAYPGEEARYFGAMAIGGAPAAADEGAEAILAGVKTTTSSGFWAWPDGLIPFVGSLCVLLDGRNRMRAIVETARVEIIAFGSVDEALARSYGEGDGTLTWWRSEMGDYYRREAARHGIPFSDDTELIFEWIVVAKRL